MNPANDLAGLAAFLAKYTRMLADQDFPQAVESFESLRQLLTTKFRQVTPQYDLAIEKLMATLNQEQKQLLWVILDSMSQMLLAYFHSDSVFSFLLHSKGKKTGTRREDMVNMYNNGQTAGQIGDTSTYLNPLCDESLIAQRKPAH